MYDEIGVEEMYDDTYLDDMDEFSMSDMDYDLRMLHSETVEGRPLSGFLRPENRIPDMDEELGMHYPELYDEDAAYEAAREFGQIR